MADDSLNVEATDGIDGYATKEMPSDPGSDSGVGWGDVARYLLVELSVWAGFAAIVYGVYRAFGTGAGFVVLGGVLLLSAVAIRSGMED